MARTALVINPWVTDFKLYDEWMHPLGLYFLISLLTFNGFDVHYCNCLRRDPTSKPKRFATGDFEHREFPVLKIAGRCTECQVRRFHRASPRSLLPTRFSSAAA